jgi:hypothetical protein
MNTNEAKKLAANTTRFGYFRENAVDVYVSCPVCKTNIHTYPNAWDKAHQHVKMLRAAVLEHIKDEH